ncbi:MAG TPA: DUF4124 domain-containing protein [Burkholderiaceae bacterium]|nr:DUF4124 domain-containing protein [Burkholderiaceae bacterium]
MWGIGVLALVGLATSDAAARADLRRCEDSSGHITYSNEPCPTGTAKERSVDDRPAVEVPHDATSEKASLRSGKASSTAPATSIVPSGNAGQAKTPEHSQELAREQQKSLVARCDDLVRRIEYAQQDQLSATPSERASIELELHRLQDEHETTCVTH